jgi:Na+:H+ antiporter, NhaA family
MYRVSSFLQHFARALIGGCLIATAWVNADPGSYYDLTERRLFALPDVLARLGPEMTVQGFVADVLMPFFLFYLGKELWESLRLERGALRGRKAGVPILAALGGMTGAALLWILLSTLFQTADEATSFTGWTVPLGSDVVLSYLFARLVFGPGSPAVHVLLLLTIAMELSGLVIQGVAFSQEGLQLLWLTLPVVAGITVWQFFGRPPGRGASERQRRRAMQLWPYLLAGAVSWFGVAAAGLPPALGLLPVLPAIPHADRAFGMFAEAEEYLTDPLNRFAQLLVWPLTLIMFLFGITHGGIDLAAWSVTGVITLAALWIGKPVGILTGALIIAPRLGYPLPPGLRRRDIGLIAGLSGISFTLPALSLGNALPGGAMQEAVRFGLALSLLAGGATVLLARRLRLKRRY